MIAFNVISLLGWSYCFFLLLNRLTTGVRPSTLIQLPSVLQRLNYALAFRSVRPPLAVVQSLALLEVVHAATGLVRTSVWTTLVQVLSRLFLAVGIVWGFGAESPVLPSSPAFVTMVVAWSLTEMVRYGYYADTLVAAETKDTPQWLIWLRWVSSVQRDREIEQRIERISCLPLNVLLVFNSLLCSYSTFYVLYPLGAGSELVLVYRTLPEAYAWNPALYYTFIFIMATYPPGFFVLFTHMIQQRRKYCSGTTATTVVSENHGRGRSATRKETFESTTTQARVSPRRRSMKSD